MSIYNSQQQKNIILSLILILGGFLIYSLIDIVSAMLGAIILYTLLRGSYIKLLSKRKFGPAGAALTVIFGSFVVIILPFFTLSWMVVDKISYYSANPGIVEELVNNLASTVGLNLQDAALIAGIIQKAENWAMGSFPSVVNAILHIFLLVAIMYFVLYFMFTQYAAFEKAILRYLPFEEEQALRMADELQKITQTNVIGQGIIALVQGICLSLGFFIFNIPDPIFWGVLAIMLSFVPLLGAALVFIPAGLIELSFDNYYSGIGILVWGVVVVSNIDNVLRLLINKKIANIHPLISIIGVIIGIPLFGILGLVFGPLLISFFLLLISIYEARLGLRKHEEILPVVFDTKDAQDENEHLQKS
jgi:predicted PurR-regulated permease PerM